MEWGKVLQEKPGSVRGLRQKLSWPCEVLRVCLHCATVHCGTGKVGRDETTQVRGGPGQELVLWGCTERATVGTSLISLSQHPCSSEEERGREGVDEGTLGDCSHPSEDEGGWVTSWVTRCWRGRWNDVDRGSLFCA